MKLRLIVLAAVAALIGAALLLLLPINASYSGAPIGCGTVFNPDTTKAEHTDDINHLGDNGFKVACDSASSTRLGWGIGLGAAGVLGLAGAFVVGQPKQRSADTKA